MAEVQAIKKLDTIKLIGHLLEIRCSKQMSDILNIGLNLALRISDLLSIQFSDIQNDRLLIREMKTGKHANIKLNQKVLANIKEIQAEHPHHIYLFQSYRNQQALNSKPRPLTRRAVTKAFVLEGEELKLALGTHSMRKTRGYHLYQNTKDIGRVMKILKHNLEGVTLRYIGITQDDVDKDFDLEKKVWNLPKERSKSAVGITIPLPEIVIDWIQELKIRACGSEYVFPSRRTSKNPHMGADTLNRAITKLFGHEAGKKKQPPNLMVDMAHFTVHDLRRTCRTLLVTTCIAIGYLLYRFWRHV
jgi:integrase